MIVATFQYITYRGSQNDVLPGLRLQYLVHRPLMGVQDLRGEPRPIKVEDLERLVGACAEGQV